MDGLVLLVGDHPKNIEQPDENGDRSEHSANRPDIVGVIVIATDE